MILCCTQELSSSQGVAGVVRVVPLDGGECTVSGKVCCPSGNGGRWTRVLFILQARWEECSLCVT